MDANSGVNVVASNSSASHMSPVEPHDVTRAVKGSPHGLKSSPPPLPTGNAMEIDPPASAAGDVVNKSDSEAETIVLPGKDGHSPSKIRKSIKHEDHSEDEEIKDAPKSLDDSDKMVNNGKTQTPGESMPSTLGKRKRSKHGVTIDDNHHLGNSSGLSSVPTSPVATTRSSLSKPAASDSELSKSPSPRSRSRSSVRDKAKSVDRAFPRRRHYASGSGDDDEEESPNPGIQRGTGEHKSYKDSRLGKRNAEGSPYKRVRSTSPPGRAHKRSVSTQLPSKSSHGLSHKKKRVPAPLQSTEYNSDESSASGNHPRSSRLRSLVAPMTGESAISPAKMPHKKHVNSSGQTQLAIACNRGRLEAVKQRYEDRPEDINVADHALNTPLHIASLSGSADIVKFLLDTGRCDLNPINLEKDAPLHDAIDNKHVKVVKLLLDAGANPNVPNKNQNEPVELLDLMLDQEEEDAEDEDPQELEAAKLVITEMRKAILAAKRRYMNARRGSEDHQMLDHTEGRDSHTKEVPRDTPPTHDLLTSGPTKGRTARSMMKTKDRALWAVYTNAELRDAATEGDLEFIYQFLNVKSDVNDPRALYNAARGGHDAIINLFFALGKFNPDPDPLDGLPHDQDTPILAAIGKDDHLEVLKLFIGNADFNPTRRIKGETYFEIAKRRAGPKSQEEERLLKEAFSAYQKTHKASPIKPRSPGLRRDGRELDRDGKKSTNVEDAQASRTHKRSMSSPKSKETETSKSQPRGVASGGTSKDASNSAKRGPGRPKKEESSISNALSDRETSPLAPPKQKIQMKHLDSELTSENEPKPRRKKLVSRTELNEREQQRRTSIASNASTNSVKEKRERLPNEPKAEKSDGKSNLGAQRTTKNASGSHAEREANADKSTTAKDRARSLKRDDSKDRLSAIRGESPMKRSRQSETPPRSSMQEVTAAYESGEAPQKRRKLESDASGRKLDKTSSSSPEHRAAVTKSTGSFDTSKSAPDPKSKARNLTKPGEPRDKKDQSASEKASPNRQNKDKSIGTNVETSKKPRPPLERQNEEPTLHRSASATSSEGEAQRQSQLRRQKKDAEVARLKDLDQERLREKEREKEQDRVREREREEKEKERERERERDREREREIEREREKERERERIEAAKVARLAREQAERDDQERRDKEERDRQERQRIADAEAQARAAEEARVLYEEQQRMKREEAQRRHAALLEQQRAEQVRIEKEKRDAELSRLPLLLRWFDMLDEPKSAEVANLLRSVIGYRYDTINQDAEGEPSGREQWMLNTHAALLLGEKDLQLARFPAWDRIHLSPSQKRGVWMNNGTDGLYSLFNPPLSELRKQFPDDNPGHVVISNNNLLFLDLDLFFVKVSEFLFVVPNFPHLRNIELEVKYQELRLPNFRSDVEPPINQMRWKTDPDTIAGQTWAPRPKYYMNGVFTRQGDIPKARILKEPPPVEKVPRREGITRMHEDDFDYEEQCKKQGLYDRLPGYQPSPGSSNNILADIDQHHERINGITPPMSEKSKSVNGGSPHRSSLSESVASHGLTNGVNTQDDSPPIQPHIP